MKMDSILLYNLTSIRVLFPICGVVEAYTFLSVYVSHVLFEKSDKYNWIIDVCIEWMWVKSL